METSVYGIDPLDKIQIKAFQILDERKNAIQFTSTK